MHRIDGPGATVDNKFTEGDPVGGIQATVVTDDFLNDVQEELISVLTAAGVNPVKGSQDQVIQAIYKLVQLQKSTAFATAGTASALTLTPVPAIGAYAAPLRFRVKFSQNSTPTSTINVSGKGAKLLKQYDISGVKVPAVYAIDQLGDIEYDGTDFVLLDQLPSTSKQGIRGSASNWKASASGASSSISVSCDRVNVEDSSGNCLTLSGVSATLDTSLTASATVNGMAGGAVAASTWYAVYVWYNPATSVYRITADAFFFTPTAPASGFTYWARRGAFRTDSTANKYPLGFTQNGSRVRYEPAPGSNLTEWPAMASGAAGSFGASVFTPVAVSVSNYVPPTATIISVCPRAPSAPGNASGVTPTSTGWGGWDNTNQPPIVSESASGAYFGDIPLKATNIFWASNDSAGRLQCFGWEDGL